MTLTDQNGTARTTKTGSFGYYRFDNIATGAAYTVGVVSKRYRFAPKVVEVTSSLSDADFTALE